MKQVPHNQIAHEILTKLGFTIEEYDIVDERHGSITLSKEALPKEELPKLINNLNAILSRIAEKEGNIPLFFDINGYKKKREGIITQLAEQAAQKVVETKESLPLPPMNSYERRLIHQALTENEKITTQSAGGGRERHVVVSFTE